MNSLTGSISMLAVVLIGLAVMVGKLDLAPALLKIGALLLLLIFLPCVLGLVGAALSAAMKPLLFITALSLLSLILIGLLLRTRYGRNYSTRRTYDDR